jgi:hypothetical protein
MFGPAETYSMIGSQALACVELAPHQYYPKRARRTSKPAAAPRPRDAVAAGTCARCGTVGRHRSPDACIEALRAEIARMEFKLEEPRKAQLEREPKPPAKPSEVVNSFYRALDRGARRRS